MQASEFEAAVVKSSRGTSDKNEIYIARSTVVMVGVIVPLTGVLVWKRVKALKWRLTPRTGLIVAADAPEGAHSAQAEKLGEAVTSAVLAAERTVADAAALERRRSDRARRRRQAVAAKAAEEAAQTADKALRSIKSQVEEMAATVSAAASEAASSLAHIAGTSDPEAALVASRLAKTVAAAAESLTEKTAMAAVTVALAASQAVTRAAEAEAEAETLDEIDNESSAAAVSDAAEVHIETVRELARFKA